MIDAATVCAVGAGREGAAAQLTQTQIGARFGAGQWRSLVEKVLNAEPQIDVFGQLIAAVEAEQVV